MRYPFLMRRIYLAIAFLVVFGFAAPASACESCGMYFDWQSLTWCKFCKFDYCGYFQCVVIEGQYGLESCDTPWEDADGDDECFTYEGILKGRCSAEPSPHAELVPAVEQPEWRLVRSQVQTPTPKAQSLSRAWKS